MARIAKYAVGLTGVLVAFLLVSLLILQLPAVKTALVHRALGVVEAAGGPDLEVSSVQGLFPWEIRTRQLQMKADGISLLAEDVEVKWSPLRLLSGEIVIDLVTSRQTSILMPEEDAQQAKSESPFRVPDIPAMRVGQFAIDTLLVAREGARTEASFRVNGAADLLGPQKWLTLDAIPISDEGDSLSIRLEYDRESDRLDGAVRVVFREGGVHEVFGGGDAPTPLSIEIEGSGPASDWSGVASIRSPGRMSADLTLHCRCQKDWQVGVNGALRGGLVGRLPWPVDSDEPYKLGLQAAGDFPARAAKRIELHLDRSDIAAEAVGQLSLEDGLSFAVEGKFSSGGTSELPTWWPTEWSIEGRAGSQGAFGIDNVNYVSTLGEVTLEEGRLFGEAILSGQLSGHLDLRPLLKDSSALDPVGPLTLDGDVHYSRSGVFSARNLSVRSDSLGVSLVVDGVYDQEADSLFVNSEGSLEKAIALGKSELAMTEPFELEIEATGLRQQGSARLNVSLPDFSFGGEDYPPLNLLSNVEGLSPPKRLEVRLDSSGSTHQVRKLAIRLGYDAAVTAKCTLSLRASGQGYLFRGLASLCAQRKDGDVWTATAALTDAGVRESIATDLRLDGRWRKQSSSFDLVVQGEGLNVAGVSMPMISSEMSGSLGDARGALQVASLDVRLEQGGYALASPFELTFGPKDVVARNLHITAEDGGAAVVEHFSLADAVTIESRFERFAVPVLPLRLDGKVQLSVADDIQTGEVDLTLASRGDNTIPSQIRLQSEWKDGAITGVSTYAIDPGGSDAVSGQLAEWSVPVRVTRRETGWDLEPGSATASLTYDGAIEPLMALLPVYAHEIAGNLKADAHLESRVNRLIWRGSATLNEADYAYDIGGIALNNFDAGVDVEGNGLTFGGTVSVLQAGSEGKTARVAGEGRVSWRSTRDWLVDLDLDLNEASLLRHENYKGTASGSLSLDANPEQGLLAGHLVFDRIDATIPSNGGKEVVHLKIIPVRADGTPVMPPRVPRATTLLPELELDVRLQADGQVFVRGRGLDTEWSGSGHIHGTGITPLISGEIAVKRGSVDFGGRLFQIESGKASLLGSGDARLDVSASNRLPDGTLVRIIITGTVAEPLIAFKSEPALPEEDVVALILFGKPVEALGAIEALRTAAALARASGQTGSFGADVFERAREAAGVDYLSIDPGGNGEQGPIITAGKYLGKGVFLMLKESLDGAEGAIALEYAITPSITLQTEVNQAAESKTSILWRRDY